MNNFSRTTGFQSFSPGMKQVIRHVMQVFPEGFATVSNSSQPLESSSVQPVAVMNANGMQPVEAYHYCTSESFAVIQVVNGLQLEDELLKTFQLDFQMVLA